MTKQMKQVAGLFVMALTLATTATPAPAAVILGGNQQIPPDQPACPSGDLDGDGVCNTVDNCLSTYNPTQIDVDGDGRGDICDPCPTSTGWGRTWFGDDESACGIGLAPISSSSGVKDFGPRR